MQTLKSVMGSEIFSVSKYGNCLKISRRWCDKRSSAICGSWVIKCLFYLIESIKESSVKFNLWWFINMYGYDSLLSIWLRTFELSFILPRCSNWSAYTKNTWSQVEWSDKIYLIFVLVEMGPYSSLHSIKSLIAADSFAWSAGLD